MSSSDLFAKKSNLYKLLPHREPMLMLDSIKRLSKEEITATKQLSEQEFGFKGHFPENPVFPGALLLEAMSQAAVALISYNLKLDHTLKQYNIFMTGLEDVRLHKTIKPGDNLDIITSLYKTRGSLWLFSSEIISCSEIAEEKVATAHKLKAMVNN
jgi:3-hydroxyacyl-[acyl-carrier-protein] dehydratase